MSQEKIIIALDVDEVSQAETLIHTLGESCAFYKIGYQLSLAGGLSLIPKLKSQGKRVFLDWKLHDIGATVEKAVRVAEKLGVDFLTVHAYPYVLEAAMQGRETVTLLGVTVLTSLDANDLVGAGFKETDPKNLTLQRANSAVQAGVQGVIASPKEAEMIRGTVPPEFLIVTPGIRPPLATDDDQKRIATPEQAFKAGANYLVIGRPVTAAKDPRFALEAIIEGVSSKVQRIY